MRSADTLFFPSLRGAKRVSLLLSRLLEKLYLLCFSRAFQDLCVPTCPSIVMGNTIEQVQSVIPRVGTCEYDEGKRRKKIMC